MTDIVGNSLRREVPLDVASDEDRAIQAAIALEIVDAYQFATWRERIDYMVVAVSGALAARDHALYALDVGTAEYVIDTSSRGISALPTRVPFDQAVGHDADQGDFVSAFASAVQSGLHTTADRWRLLPVSRPDDATPLFVLALDDPRPTDWSGIQSLLSPLLAAYVTRRVGHLIDGTRETIDYHVSWEIFMRRLGEVLLAASGFQYAALREVRGDRLDCLGAWGFPETRDLRAMSWPRDRYRSFARASRGEAVAVRDLVLSEDREIGEIPGLEPIHGFVTVPVIAGTEIFGVLSVATTVPYAVTTAELSALQALGNIVGIGISFFRNPSGSAPGLEAMTDVSARTQLEIIGASARHEGSGLIDNAMHWCGELSKQDLGASRRRDASRKLEETLFELSGVIDKIQHAAKPPSYDWKTVSLKRLWQNVCGYYSGRLDAMRIDPTESGPDVLVACYPDWIESVLSQLVLNSIDAFGRKGIGLRPPSNERRMISLTIDPIRGRGDLLTFRYSDNATGIQLASLKTRERFLSLPLEQQLFTPGASTKKGREGGLGLALARTAISEHGGSLELQDNSVQGVTFRIELPIDPKVPAGGSSD